MVKVCEKNGDGHRPHPQDLRVFEGFAGASPHFLEGQIHESSPIHDQRRLGDAGGRDAGGVSVFSAAAAALATALLGSPLSGSTAEARLPEMTTAPSATAALRPTPQMTFAFGDGEGRFELT